MAQLDSIAHKDNMIPQKEESYLLYLILFVKMLQLAHSQVRMWSVNPTENDKIDKCKKIRYIIKP